MAAAVAMGAAVIVNGMQEQTKGMHCHMIILLMGMIPGGVMGRGVRTRGMVVRRVILLEVILTNLHLEVEE